MLYQTSLQERDLTVEKQQQDTILLHILPRDYINRLLPFAENDRMLKYVVLLKTQI